MSLEWMDGADHYGSIANILAGVFAEYYGGGGGALAISTANPRTGTSHFRITGLSSSSRIIWRRVLGAARTAVGLAFGCWINVLPSANSAFAPMVFRTAANTVQVAVFVDSTGVITVRQTNGSGAILAQSAAPAIVAGGYQYIEAYINCHSTTGSVEVRVDGVTVASASNVNTNPRATGEISQVSSDLFTTHGLGTIDYDDLYCWNSLGSTNNSFPGNVRVGLSLLNADEAASDWTRNTGSTDFSATTEIPPDGDTTYIEATAVNAVSEFGIADAPANVSSILAVQSYVMMKKTDAGASQVQASMLSGASVAAGADRPITTTYTYWMDAFEVDPATGAPWTPSAFNAAKLRLKRTV